jgi:6-pyruvoyltetrahydropterin/6-carboxytetrahydropterin synthase
VFEVGVVGHFEAAHSLRGDFGPASNIHGHTYRVEATARGPELSSDGALVDITLLQSALDNVIDILHYRNLDEVEELAGMNTTAEVMTRFFFDRISEELRESGVESLAIRLWESPRAFAGYESALE